MSKFNEVTVICNAEHLFTPGICLACERDQAVKQVEWLRNRVLELTFELDRYRAAETQEVKHE